MNPQALPLLILCLSVSINALAYNNGNTYNSELDPSSMRSILRINPESDSPCSSVLIAPNTVLTVSHCLKRLPITFAQRFYRDHGSIDFKANSIEWNNKTIKVLDGIALNDIPGSFNEIVILKLAENLNTDQMMKIPSLEKLENIFELSKSGIKQELYGAGFGIDPISNPKGKILNWGAMILIGHEPEWNLLRLSAIRETESPTLPSGGDSGGALFDSQAKELYGIALFNDLSQSFSNPIDNIKNSTAYFISLPHKRKWIKDSCVKLDIQIDEYLSD